VHFFRPALLGWLAWLAPPFWFLSAFLSFALFSLVGFPAKNNNNNSNDDDDDAESTVVVVMVCVGTSSIAPGGRREQHPLQRQHVREHRHHIRRSDGDQHNHNKKTNSHMIYIYKIRMPSKRLVPKCHDICTSVRWHFVFLWLSLAISINIKMHLEATLRNLRHSFFSPVFLGYCFLVNTGDKYKV